MPEPTVIASPEDPTTCRGPGRARLAVGAAAATAVLLAGGIAVAAGAGGSSGTSGSSEASSPDVTVDDSPGSDVTAPEAPDTADQTADVSDADEVEDHGTDPATGTDEHHGQDPAVVPPVAGTPPRIEVEDQEDDATEVEDDHGVNGTPEVDDEDEPHSVSPGVTTPRRGDEDSDSDHSDSDD